MRATRAYIAGFGTAGSLLAGAAMVFVLASAVVAFRGWPQVGTPATPALVVVARPHLAGGSRVERQLYAAAVSVTTPASAAVAAGRASGGAGVSKRPAGTWSQRVATSTGSSSGVAIPPRTVTTGQPPVTTPGCGTSCSTPISAVTGTVSTVVQSATGAVGNTVAAAGTALGSTVSGVANTVASKLAGLSPGLANTVSQAGAPLGGTVAKTTGSAANIVSGLGNTLGGALGALGQKH
jgi:hypothetical protein